MIVLYVTGHDDNDNMAIVMITYCMIMLIVMMAGHDDAAADGHDDESYCMMVMAMAMMI